MNISKEACFPKKRADMWDPKVREKRGGRRWTAQIKAGADPTAKKIV